jgi:hypothetical protein
MPLPPNPLRDQVLTLARRGEIATATEAAWIAAVSRQVAHRWIAAAGIDLEACRARRIALLRRQAERIAEGKPVRHRTKAQQRAAAEKALRDWNERQRKSS